jgi:chromate reductase
MATHQVGYFIGSLSTTSINRLLARSLIRVAPPELSFTEIIFKVYSRSIPGGLKNAIDRTSRPYGTNAFARKPSATIGTSPGAIGTPVAQQHLRSLLEATETFLHNYMSELHLFISRVLSVLPRIA